SGERKAELAARYASRRVDEAAALSLRGELDEETADMLADRFDGHIATLAQETEELEAEGETAVPRAVRASLEQELAGKAEAFASEDAGDGAAVLAVAA